uniref:Uncharacterized protein LOC104238232 n=1 Tax=Nicotiana sylvestris TaxID=4096 RepID=A0A1U7XIY1_NICSY|nr:PREDICTED: uncharacterized protein LOC104238232 [Nicotiana sylvestris]XP_009790838.1 PREDICTED: uncharacterized protein LOC104238232 [Nicotiana sylvestris]
MASQIEENLRASSTNAISLDDESQRPSQPDEVELKKRRYSRAWDHFEPVKVKGVPYGACLTSTVDQVSCPTLLDEEDEPDSSGLSQI